MTAKIKIVGAPENAPFEQDVVCPFTISFNGEDYRIESGNKRANSVAFSKEDKVEITFNWFTLALVIIEARLKQFRFDKEKAKQMKIEQMDTTKEGIKNYLYDAGVKLKAEWHAQQTHKLAVGLFVLDTLGITDQAIRDGFFKQFMATPSSFACNSSAMAQQLGRESKKEALTKVFSGFWEAKSRAWAKVHAFNLHLSERKLLKINGMNKFCIVGRRLSASIEPMIMRCMQKKENEKD